MYVCMYAAVVWIPKGGAQCLWEAVMDIGTENGSVDWIHLSQVRAQMHALVEFVLNFQVSWKMGNTSTSWVSVSYTVALFFMELITMM